MSHPLPGAGSDAGAATRPGTAAGGRGVKAAASRIAPDPLFRRILRNTGVLLGGKVATGLLNLAAFSVAMHSLGSARMGVLVLAHSLAQTVATFVKFQSWQAVLRFGTGSLDPSRRAEMQALLRFTTMLDLASAGAGALVACAAAWFLGPSLGWPSETLPLATAYATVSAFLVVATPVGLLRLFDRFDLLAQRDAAGAAFRLAGTLVAAALGAGLPGFLAAWYGAAVLGAVALVAGAWHETARRGLLRPVPHGRRVRATQAHPGLWGFVWTTNLMTTLSLGSGQLATLCVGWILGPAETALFALARRLGEAALKPSRFLTPVFYPEFAQLAVLRDRNTLRHLLRRSLLLSTILALALLAFLAVAGEWLLRLTGGLEAQAAYPVMLLLAVAAAIGLAGFALEPLHVSVGRHALALRLRLAATVTYVPLALVGLTWLGLEGAGLAAIASALLLLVGQAVPAMRWLAGAEVHADVRPSTR